MPKSGYLRHFHACNQHDPAKFVPFYIGAQKLGHVTKELAVLLPGETDFFGSHQNGIVLAPHLDNFTTRSDALAATARWIAARFGRELRGEMYPVIMNYGHKPLAQIDRAAVPWFGLKGFGVHVNGFVKKPDGLHLWIGERARDRMIDPGKFDNLIGGGQPIGLTARENLRKEATEEAGIGAALANQAKETGAIHYLLERQHGLRNDVLFLFDLELPADFTPINTDGEVAAFHLMPIAEVADLVRDTDRFKFNCNLVIIDFLMRHGFFTKADGEYDALRAAMAQAKA